MIVEEASVDEDAGPAPTVEELDGWLEAMRGGYGITGMMPRFVRGYKQLSKENETLWEYIEEQAGCICEGKGGCAHCKLVRSL